MSARLTALALNRKSFCFETNLASKGIVGRIDRLSQNGFHTKMIFMALPDVEVALARVAARVLAGGHDVPEETIRRRFKAGLHYFFNTYRLRVDSWSLWENASEEPTVVANPEDHLTQSMNTADSDTRSSSHATEKSSGYNQANTELILGCFAFLCRASLTIVTVMEFDRVVFQSAKHSRCRG